MTDPALDQFLGAVPPGPPGLGDPFADPFAMGADGGDLDGTVSCQVCRTQIDAATGEPVGPVDPMVADEAARYVAGAGSGGSSSAGVSEMGGVALL